MWKERTSCTAERAAEWMRELEQQRRYLADVFA